MLRKVPSWVSSIVAVDDASQDSTSAVIASIHDPRIVLVRHGVNQGVGAAIVTGYQTALQMGADVIVVMAGDDQMDPQDLPGLVAPIAQGQADYVKGNRFVHSEVGRMPLLRRAAGAFLSYITRLASGLRVDDTQCGYTAISASAAARLPLSDLWPRFGYPNDLLMLIAASHLRLLEVPVRPVYADESSGLRPWHVLQILAVIYRRWRCARAKFEQRAALSLPASSLNRH